MSSKKKVYNKNLHSLILSLSAKETGKILRQLKKKKAPRILWKLFSVYNQKEAPAEKDIRSVNPAYSVYQNRLKEFIIEFLHIESDSVEKEIASYISKGNLLYFKKQYELAFVELEKGIKLAHYHGHDELELKFTKLLIKLVNAGKTPIRKQHKSAEDYFGDRARLVENIATAHEIMSTRLKARQIAISTAAHRSDNGKIEEYKQFYLKLAKEKNLSATNRYYWLNCMEMIYRVTGELDKVNEILQETYEHLEENSFITENNPLIRTMTLIKLFRNALYKKNLPQAEFYCQRIQTLEDKSPKQELYLFEYFPFLERQLFLLQELPSPTIFQKVKVNKENYERLYSELNVECKFLYPHLYSICAILAQENVEALRALERARKEFKHNHGWRKDVFFTFDLHMLAIQYGLGNFGLLPSLSKNAERLFQREEINGEWQKSLLAFFKDKKLENSPADYRRKQLKKLAKKIEALASEDNSIREHFVEHLDWKAWLDLQIAQFST